jgi:hypothetical protein
MPRGKLVRVVDGQAIVRLDDGTLRETHIDNLRRADGWKQPATRRRATRVPPPLDEGWEQPQIDFGEAS